MVGLLSRRMREKLWPSLKSAGCTTDTNGSPPEPVLPICLVPPS